MRLLRGSISCEDSSWLSFGQWAGQQRKLFEVVGDLVVPVQVRGSQLRAGVKPLEGTVVVESNGGNAAVVIRGEVPVTPFPEGVLAGATTPRQIAQRCKMAPQEAAPLFEKGAVVKWFEQNGWTYPDQGPPASGLGAVQQFFEALGLTAPPKVYVSEPSVRFAGEVGDRVEHTLFVRTEENRPVYASATSNQKWLEIGCPLLTGRTAAIPLVVPRVPNRPGGVLTAQVLVTANGKQQFAVDVMLAVGTSASPAPPVLELVEDVIPMARIADWHKQPPARRRK
jgi:hypothetical protein